MRKTEKTRWNVLKAIITVSDALKDSQFHVKFNDKQKTAHERLCGYFATERMETWFMCAIANITFDDEKSDDASFMKLAKFFGVESLEILTRKKFLDKLVEKKLIQSKNKGYGRLNLKDSKCFYLSLDVTDAILDNKIIKNKTADENEVDAIGFVTQIADCIDEGGDDDMDVFTLNTILENKYKHLKIIKDMKKIIPVDDDRVLFYYTCYKFMAGRTVHLAGTLNRLYKNREQFRIAKNMMNGTHPLMKNELLEFATKGSLSGATVSLTEKGRELFLGEDADLFNGQMNTKELLMPDDIMKKDLFYSQENMEEIDRVRSAVTEENFIGIQERLKSEAFPIGVAILLYGAPGTGKTESVFQIAKATGRAVLRVDISNTKSCWFGESEKMIKRIFAKYKRMCDRARKNEGEKIPILLFNEADAVLSKRKDSTRGNLAQTENAIQNIILEEMEKLTGIMIATTNLANNLDAAFERRFLFKIKFENPTVEAKKQIWHSKLSWLNDSDALHFAECYDFSGGEIDNIAKKITMDEIITGSRPSISSIEKMCDTEKISKTQKRRIGFGE